MCTRLDSGSEIQLREQDHVLSWILGLEVQLREQDHVY